jgi:PAS domain S-box-containing protein
MRRVKDLSIDDLHNIVRTVDAGITLQAPDGKLIYANDAAARIIGFASAEALLASTIAEIMQAFDILDENGNALPATEIPSRKALQGVEVEQLLKFRVRETAEERWSILKSTPSFDANGSLKFVINIFEDVTDRKNAEDALRVSKEWFSTTLTSLGDAVIATDRNGCVTFLNPVAEAVTGWSNQEAEGRTLESVFRIINESPVEKVLIRKDGSQIAIDDSAAPIKSADGAVVGVVLIFRDVEGKRREEKRVLFIQDAIGKLSSSLDYESTLNAVAQLAVPHIADWCAVDVVQEDGSIKQLAVAHVDPDKIALAKDMSRRYPTPPEAQRGVRQALRTGKTEWVREIPDAMLIAAAVDDEHLRIARSLGLKAYIIAPMIARGRVLGAISFVAADRVRTFSEKDVQLAETIAERAAIALDNARLFHDAERATTLRDQLLSIVSHDLRSPLNAITVGVSGLQRRLSDRPELVNMLELLSMSAERMERMIRQLLDFSRATAGHELPMELRDAVLNDVCQNVVAELRMGRPDVKVLVDATDPLRGRWDPDRMGEVISNLVGNAMQYGDGGPVSVTLRRDQAQAIIEVHNHGDPIAEALLPHLFDPFRRGTTVRKAGGVGLGLYIARSIVVAHAGHIEVESAAEAGTRFTVRLPINPT